MQATLKIPAFTNGCLQLSLKDVEDTSCLANVKNSHGMRYQCYKAKVFNSHEYFANQFCQASSNR